MGEEYELATKAGLGWSTAIYGISRCVDLSLVYVYTYRRIYLSISAFGQMLSLMIMLGVSLYINQHVIRDQLTFL